MSFFETPKLQDIVLRRRFPNVCTDLISSHHAKNRRLLRTYQFLEEHYFGIDTHMKVSEYSFKSHIHIEPHYSNDTGYFRLYYSGSDKTIFVVPQRGSFYGYNSARLLASHLALNGFNVCEIVTPFHENRLPEGITSVTQLPVNAQTIKLVSKQAIEEILGLINFIGGEKIGIAGISQGTAYADIVSEIAPIKSSVYIHGFGDLASLLLYSKDRFAERFREEELRRSGSIDELLLREELKDVEPLTYVKPTHSNDTIMINAKNDASLPESNILALWKALGKPRIYLFYMPFLDGHYSLFIRSKKILKIVAEHFNKTIQ